MDLPTLPEDTSLDALLQTHPMLLLQFTSPRCAPCAALRDRIAAWVQKTSRVSAYAVPIEHFPVLCGQLGVFTVPTALVYVEGRLTLRKSGSFRLNPLH